MCLEKLSEFTEEHSYNIVAIDSPCDLLVDFGKCILNMLHYRVLSWNQFKVFDQNVNNNIVSDKALSDPN